MDEGISNGIGISDNLAIKFELYKIIFFVLKLEIYFQKHLGWVLIILSAEQRNLSNSMVVSTILWKFEKAEQTSRGLLFL
jgi:hypothetical protein